ncbi:MAG: ABC transporter permease subunit, partial [candidate division KSB1 bacterium]
SGMAHSLFMSNHVGMRLDGHWNLVRYLPFMQSGELEIGVAPLPASRFGRKANVMYESGWCVPRNVKHPELAVKLAAFLSGEYACRERSALGLALPAVKSVAAEQAARDTLGIEQVFFDEVAHCRQPWGTRVERFTELELLFQDALDETLVNHRPLRESLTRSAERIDEKLAQISSNETTPLPPLAGNKEILRFLFGVAAAMFAVALLGLALSKARERIAMMKGFLFLLPSALHLILFLLTPIAFALYLSVHDWEVIVPQKTFVGLKNFGEMFGDALFWNALKNTLLYSLNVPLCMVLALGVAVLLHQKLRGINLLRTLYFLPSVSSLVAIALVWRLLYEPNFGLANFILQTLGLPPMQWLNAPATAMLSLIIMSVWLGLGYQMVIFLAGLQGIPEMFYEAATIDGASAWQRFRHITLPQLRPTTFFVLVTSLIGSFQVFTTVFMMTGGGPARSTDVVVFHIYQAAWDNLRMGYASAMSMVLFGIIMIATWAQFKLMRSTQER